MDPPGDHQGGDGYDSHEVDDASVPAGRYDATDDAHDADHS